jgi:hypothetical protein
MGPSSERLIAPNGEPSGEVRIVLVVARLGEMGLRGWWRSHGLNQAGRYVLGSAFPRTWLATGLELAVESATRRHRDALRRDTALHLFSDHLPFRRWAVAWLREQKSTAGTNPFLEGLRTWDSVDAIENLRAAAGRPPRGEAIGEGLHLGVVKRSDFEGAEGRSRILGALGATYVDLGDNFQAPYFDLER